MGHGPPRSAHHRAGQQVRPPGRRCPPAPHTRRRPGRNLLCIEITETALLSQTATATDNVAGIHERGVGIAIDDFGTGYASLLYLRRYPINVIKIDRSFVTNITTDEQDQAITTAIIALASALGMTVTAEGVEYPDQAACLHDLGCPSAQGWHYSTALPGVEVTPLLDHIYPHN